MGDGQHKVPRLHVRWRLRRAMLKWPTGEEEQGPRRAFLAMVATGKGTPVSALIDDYLAGEGVSASAGARIPPHPLGL